MMMESVLSASARYPKDPAFQPSYGTAGFRAEASLLASTMFRCGIIAALRSRQAGQAVGVMVTASHNPERDNGVKIVEPNGEYLHRQWEEHATAAATVETDAGLVEQVERIVAKETIAPGPCKVLVGHDTRPSCPALVCAVQDGVAAVGGEVVDCGLQTTPQLHFRVWSLNRGEAWTESDYYRVLIAGYKAFAGAGGATSSPLVVDCANGIGGVKLQEMLDAGLDQAGIQLQLRNTGGGPLNDGCGSDYVQKERQLPAGFQDLEVGTRCCSLDGDADRLVYFSVQEGGGLQLFDGDQIAVLMAVCMKDLLEQIGGSAAALSVGIVQTAYANGASTKFIRDHLQLPVVCAKTGVKHLHAEAVKFDIGIYFEANGHGTVLLQPAVLQAMSKLEGHAASQQLLAFAHMINQAVGDAISGILAVEAVLGRKGWSLASWSELYRDLPSRQTKVKVQDRSAITTELADTRCTAPPALQPAIDAAVARHPGSRAFVRPSGTEDIVRVYAEAASATAADALALSVAQLVHRLAYGIGPEPSCV